MYQVRAGGGRLRQKQHARYFRSCRRNLSSYCFFSPFFPRNHSRPHHGRSRSHLRAPLARNIQPGSEKCPMSTSTELSDIVIPRLPLSFCWTVSTPGDSDHPTPSILHQNTATFNSLDHFHTTSSRRPNSHTTSPIPTRLHLIPHDLPRPHPRQVPPSNQSPDHRRRRTHHLPPRTLHLRPLSHARRGTWTPVRSWSWEFERG